MASLINRIQRAMLGSAGPEKVRALLAELAIPAGGSGEHALRHARRGFLRPISDEAILRDALGDLGLTGGGGGGGQALSDARNAILHNLRDSETTLRDGLNGLLEPGDLGEGGGGGAPEWVPEGAVIHIDLVGGDPQGRAWVEGTGVVAVNTLLGSDADADGYFGDTAYNPANLTADGYVAAEAVALLGTAKSLTAGDFTAAFRFKNISGGSFVVATASTDGSERIIFETDSPDVISEANQGTYFTTISDVLNTGDDELNALSVTLTGTRAELAVNGSAVDAAVISSAERPASLVAFGLSADAMGVQSITIYAALPTTAGLSELSEV